MQPSFETLDRPGGLARVGLLRPLRASRDFRVLWAGMAVSLVGDGIFLIAIAWTAFSLWNAPGALAVIGLAMTVPMIFCLLAGGAVSDRFDRRRVLIVSDLARAAAVAAIAALGFAGALTFPLLAVLAGLYSAAGAFFVPAFDAIVPSLVVTDHLPAANSLDQFVRPIALRLAGPALGGLIVASFGASTAFVLDAVTFAASTGAIVAVRTSLQRSFPCGINACGNRRRVPLRPQACLALGNPRICRDCVPRLPRPDRGTCSLRRQERSPRLGRRPRHRLRGRRNRSSRSRGRHGPAWPAST